MADIGRAEHVKRYVIGVLIATAIVGGTAYYWQDILGGLGSFFTWLGEPVSVSRWWYGLLLLVAVGFVVLIVAAAIVGNRLPEYAEYTEDEFFGFVWRWNWNAQGHVLNLQWYCRVCDRIGVYSQDHYERVTTFFCSECDRPVERPGTRDQMINSVLREINLKVRSGRWKKIVEARKAAV